MGCWDIYLIAGEKAILYIVFQFQFQNIVENKLNQLINQSYISTCFAEELRTRSNYEYVYKWEP